MGENLVRKLLLMQVSLARLELVTSPVEGLAEVCAGARFEGGDG